MKKELEDIGASCEIGKGCSCTNSLIAYNYTLPVKIDKDIENFMGTSSTSIEKQQVFKIETNEYLIIAITKLNHIKLSFKKNDNLSFINEFEDKLYNYVDSKIQKG